MRWFDNLGLGLKLALLTMAVIVGVAGGGMACARLMEREMLANRVDELRAVTTTAKGIAEGLQAQVAAGELAQDEAVRQFSRRVRSMVYDGGQGYVFAYRMDGSAVAVPDPAQIGSNRLDVSVNGRPVIREIRDAVLATGEAVIHYDSPHPGQAVASPKISYATAFAPWDLFLGTGSYVDDISTKLHSLMIDMAAGVAALSVVIGGLAFIITRRITRPLGSLQQCMRKLAAGQLGADVPGVSRRDEMGAMAASVQVFKENALRARALEQEQEIARAHRAAEDERVRWEADAKAAAEAAALVVARARRVAEDEQVRREADAESAAAAAALVVGSIGKGLANLAAGDLTARLEEPLPAAYEPLRHDLNSATDQLRAIVSGIIENSAAIRLGIGEITQASDDLSQRTEHQAASLEQTAAALDQVTTTVGKTADGARCASDAVQRTRSDAEKSGEVVRQAVTAMQQIEHSSQQISQILGVIDEIAFQTSLLALNASVEAAHAGDTGRGFAVVASEIRSLAQRSAEAARDIKALIATSAEHVGCGVRLVGEAGQVLSRISAEVGTITGAVTEIAASAQEQAAALNEINAAINQMDQVTQQNAAMVEQSTAASHSLAQETAALEQRVQHFEVGAAGNSMSRVTRWTPPTASLGVTDKGMPALRAAPAA